MNAGGEHYRRGIPPNAPAGVLRLNSSGVKRSSGVRELVLDQPDSLRNGLVGGKVAGVE